MKNNQYFTWKVSNRRVWFSRGYCWVWLGWCKEHVWLGVLTFRRFETWKCWWAVIFWCLWCFLLCYLFFLPKKIQNKTKQKGLVWGVKKKDVAPCCFPKKKQSTNKQATVAGHFFVEMFTAWMCVDHPKCLIPSVTPWFWSPSFLWLQVGEILLPPTQKTTRSEIQADSRTWIFLRLRWDFLWDFFLW